MGVRRPVGETRLHRSSPGACPLQVERSTTASWSTSTRCRSCWTPWTGTPSWRPPATCTRTRVAGNNAERQHAVLTPARSLIAATAPAAWNGADAPVRHGRQPDYYRQAVQLLHRGRQGRRPRIELGSGARIFSYLNSKLKPRADRGAARGRELPRRAVRLGGVLTLINFGIEGTHHTMVDGMPAATEQGNKEVQPPTFQFLASPRLGDHVQPRRRRSSPRTTPPGRPRTSSTLQKPLFCEHEHQPSRRSPPSTRPGRRGRRSRTATTAARRSRREPTPSRPGRPGRRRPADVLRRHPRRSTASGSDRDAATATSCRDAPPTPARHATDQQGSSLAGRGCGGTGRCC